MTHIAADIEIAKSCYVLIIFGWMIFAALDNLICAFENAIKARGAYRYVGILGVLSFFACVYGFVNMAGDVLAGTMPAGSTALMTLACVGTALFCMLIAEDNAEAKGL